MSRIDDRWASMAAALPYEQMVLVYPNRQGRRWEGVAVDKSKSILWPFVANQIISAQAHESFAAWEEGRRYMMGICYPACKVLIQDGSCHVVNLIDGCNFDFDFELDVLLNAVESSREPQ